MSDRDKFCMALARIDDAVLCVRQARMEAAAVGTDWWERMVGCIDGLEAIARDIESELRGREP